MSFSNNFWRTKEIYTCPGTRGSMSVCAFPSLKVKLKVSKLQYKIGPSKNSNNQINLDGTPMLYEIFSLMLY